MSLVPVVIEQTSRGERSFAESRVVVSVRIL